MTYGAIPMIFINMPISITTGAVEGAPFNPAPTIDKPIRKNKDVNDIFENRVIPSRLSGLDFALAIVL